MSPAMSMAGRFARTLAVIALMAASACAMAEIEKSVNRGPKGMEYNWWPRLPAVKEWAQDREASFQYNIYALAPAGKTFSSAETLIYGKAISKIQVPEIKSLGALIENEKKEFLIQAPGGRILENPALSAADGRKVISLTYIQKGKANLERVAYLEEDDFYVMLTVSSDSMAGFEAASLVYEDLISRYK